VSRTVLHPPADRPLVVYDGDCGFCREWIRRWQERTGPRVDYAPYQEAAERFPEIPVTSFRRAVHLIDTDGAVFAGAEAVFRTLARARRGGSWLWAYRRLPGFAPASEAAYRWVASHRDFAARVSHWTGDDPRSVLTRSLFLRALGVVYLIAFLSLWVQVDGLIGSQGILPAASFLDAVRGAFGAERYRLLPTLFWLGASDRVLHAACAAGTLLSVLLVAGIAPVLDLVLLWTLYLSLLCVSGVFLGYQWDALLLEAGLLAVLLAPRGLRPRPGSAPPRLLVWLFRWLLFRLMFASGVTKLLSGDPTWRSLSALRFHYQTQPLPTWVGYYAHGLRPSFHMASAAILFVIEIVAPLLVFAPPRGRRHAFVPLVVLQGLIALTGNYGFFNLLAVALCLFLLEDGDFPRRWRERLAPGAAEARGRRWPVLLTLPAAVLLGLLSTLTFTSGMGLHLPWPSPVIALQRRIAPLSSVNSYGLFQVMTTTRPEIVVEGSADGQVWLPYEFKWKPGDPYRRPPFVEPHQPRLDWQMWFAALGTCEENRWFVRFLQRLLQGSEPVRSLLARDPFPDRPPAFIRTTVYDYRFTDGPEHRGTGAWWRREPVGPYCPVLRRETAAASSRGTSW
jgi:predicted DCC family thiol-disulfide oxidoreductase YuxK